MEYILLALLLFWVYKFTIAWIQFREIKNRYSYELDKIQSLIDKNPANPILYCKRATIHQIAQNFIDANLDYRKALEMVKNGAPVDRRDDFERKVIGNISYTAKPLPWSKNGPKNMSNSWLVFFLIDRFGDKRYNF